jgi:hypothetical protein
MTWRLSAPFGPHGNLLERQIRVDGRRLDLRDDNGMLRRNTACTRALLRWILGAGNAQCSNGQQKRRRQSAENTQHGFDLSVYFTFSSLTIVN